jgi:hypothetical protein
LGTSGANCASSVDSAQTVQTLTVEGSGVVDLVGSTFLAADAELVGKEARGALALLRSSVVVRIDRAGDTVSVADEVVGRAELALA